MRSRSSVRALARHPRVLRPAGGDEAEPRPEGGRRGGIDHSGGGPWQLTTWSSAPRSSPRCTRAASGRSTSSTSRCDRGEIFGLLGPNGAGKTTTAGMLTTRVIPTSGRAFVGGVDVVAHPTAAKQVIGVVPQTQHARPVARPSGRTSTSTAGSSACGARPRRPRPTRLLEQFRLADRANVPVAALSGGMAQRLMVARAIMHRPAILFLDEPTAGLDPQSRIALWEILGELHARRPDDPADHALHGGGRRALRPARDHRPRPAARARHARPSSSASIGADTIVTVVGRRRPRRARRRCSTPRSPACSRSTASTAPSRVAVRGSDGRAAGGRSPPPSGTASRSPTSRSTEPTLETVFINLTGKDLRE